MNLLSGLGAASSLVKNAADLVRAAKQPELTDETFSEIFMARLQQEASPEAREARASEESGRFIRQRDIDGDGTLRLEESGLDRRVFERLDTDRNGRITIEEYQRALLGSQGGQPT